MGMNGDTDCFCGSSPIASSIVRFLLMNSISQRRGRFSAAYEEEANMEPDWLISSSRERLVLFGLECVR